VQVAEGLDQLRYVDKSCIFEHFRAMNSPKSTLLRARVDTVRYKKAEEVFSRLGMKPSDAVNIFLAQVAIRDDLPFFVTTKPDRPISDQEQADAWNESLGEY